MGSPRCWTGFLIADLAFPGACSLKDRRAPLRSLGDRLRNLGFSVSQVGPSDLPGRAWLAACCCASRESAASAMLERAAGIVRSAPVEIVELDRRICLLEGDLGGVSPDD